MKLIEIVGIRSVIKFIALLAAIIGTITYKKYKFSNAKYILFSVWFIAITEFSYKLFYYYILDGKTDIFFISNIYDLVQYNFYLWWFRSLITDRKKRNMLLGIAVIHLLLFIANSYFGEFNKPHRYFYALSVILVLIAICFYYVEILKTDRILQFERSIYFWFSLGIILFNVPFVPFWYAADYLHYSGNIYNIVVFSLNAILYGCFIIGFLYSKKQYNYS
ncbi:hypothetical protein ACG2LH_17975 [Zhouia sp. PK063]|uniref:hypothetical protein n=1 Tax=Zhouia sp. PK063 TaxID=3373602 RepID=UPI0037BC6C17